MKRLAFFILILIPSILFSQTRDLRQNGIYSDNDKVAKALKRGFDKQQAAANWNFKIENGKIYWQKVFTFAPHDSLDVATFFNKSRYFSDKGNQYKSEVILAQFNDLPTMKEPGVFQSTAEIYFYLQIKGNKYRITVTDITWRGEVNAGLFSQETSLTMQDMKDTAYSNGLKPGICKNTNICLLNLFDYRSEYHSMGAILDDDF